MTDSQTEYTRRQMWCALQLVMERVAADDRPFSPSMRVDHYLQSCGLWGEVDLGDVAESIEELLPTRIDTDEWREFLGTDSMIAGNWEESVAPRLTFGAFADFLAARVKPVSFRPVDIAGRKCAAAGAFRGIEAVIEQLQPHGRKFHPSTPILDRLRGHHLLRFWERLQWMTCNSLPRTDTRWFAVATRLFLFEILAGVVGLVIAGFRRDGQGIVLGIAAFLFGKAVVHMIEHFTNPLPPEVRTFRDLARLVADAPIIREGQRGMVQ